MNFNNEGTLIIMTPAEYDLYQQFRELNTPPTVIDPLKGCNIIIQPRMLETEE